MGRGSRRHHVENGRRYHKGVGQMKKRLIVIGGVAAGLKAAAKARRCDSEMEITVYQEEDEISYAGCGLPYYISGLVKKREDLISRTPGKFALDGIKIREQRRIEGIDIEKRTVVGRHVESREVFTDHFINWSVTGAVPSKPRSKAWSWEYFLSSFDR
jgi:NAD(P)H-nitrite reductase large subunit